MASVNENVNFSVEFDESALKSGEQSLERCNKALNAVAEAQAKISNYKFDNFRELAKQEGGIQAVTQYIIKMREAIRVLESEPVGGQFSDSLKGMKAEIPVVEKKLNDLLIGLSDVSKVSAKFKDNALIPSFNASDFHKGEEGINKVRQAIVSMHEQMEKVNAFEFTSFDELAQQEGGIRAVRDYIRSLQEAIKTLDSETAGSKFNKAISTYKYQLHEANEAFKQMMPYLEQRVAKEQELVRLQREEEQRKTDAARAAEEARLIEKQTAQRERQLAIERQREAALLREQVAERLSLSLENKRLEAQQQYVNSLQSKITSLSSGVDSLSLKYNNMFKSGDMSGLRDANQQMVQLRDRARELRDEIARASGQGIDTTQMSAQLTEIENRLNRVAGDASKNLRSQLGSAFQQVFSSLNRVATATMRGIYRTSTTLVKNWGKLLSKTFKSVVGGWSKMLKGIFSPKSTGANQLMSQIKSMLGIASLAGFVALTKQAIDLSSSMHEIQHVVNTVFPEMTEEINDFCDNAAAKFGLTALEAKNFVGVFGSMLSAADITGKAQREMSRNLSALTGDLASFYNMDTDEVFKKLQSGLAGNARAMRSFGVSMTVANLNAFALSRGIKQSYSEMSEANKTALRYNYMLNQLSHAQGDFAKTSQSWANQVRQLSGNFKQLMSILGGGLIKALYPTLQILNQIVVAAINASNALAKLFGFSQADLSQMFGTGAEMPDVSEYADDLEDVADATEDVAEATKKANENLQTFDKLNNVTQTAPAGTAQVSTGGLGYDGLIDFDSYYEKIDQAPQEMNKKLEKILNVIKGWWEDIAGVDYSAFLASWRNMSKSFDVIVGDFGNGLIWMWDNVLFPFYKWSATAGAPAVFELIGASLEALHEIILATSPEIDEFWKTHLAPFFSKKGDEFTVTVKRWTEELKKWTQGLRNADDKIQYLKDTFRTVKDKVYDWIDDDGITSRLDSIGSRLRGIFSNLISDDTKKQATSLLRTFTKLNLIVFDNILKVLDYLTGNTNVSDFVAFLVTEFGDLADFTFDEVIELFDYLVTSDDAKDTVTNIKDSIKNIIEFIVDNKELILGLLKDASWVLEQLTGHLDAVIPLLLTIGGIGAFVKLAITVGSFIRAIGTIKTALGALPGVMKPTSTTLSNSFGFVKTEAKSLATMLANEAVWAAPALAILGTTVLGIKAGFDDAKKAADNLNKSLDFQYGGDYEKAAQDLTKVNNSFNLDDTVTYTYTLGHVIDAYNGLDKKAREMVETGHTADVLTTSKMKEEAEKYIWYLEDAGYANEEYLNNLKEIVADSPSVFSLPGKHEQYKSDVAEAMRVIQQELNTQYDIINEMTEDERQVWENSWKEGIEESLGGIADSAYEVGEAATTAYGEGLSSQDLDQLYRDVMQDPIDSVESTVISGAEGLADDFTSAYSDTLSRDASMAQASEQLVSNAASRASKKASEQAPATGYNTVQGIIKGISNNASSLYTSISNLATNMLNKFKSMLGISSPAKAFAALAKFVPAGIAVGIDKNADAAYDSIGELSRNLLSSFEDCEVDMSSIIDSSKFSDKYNDILYQTDIFTRDLDKRYKDVSPLEMQSDMVISPSVKRAELAATVAQQSTTTRVAEGVSALYAKGTTGGANQIVANLILSGDRMAQFIIDTVTGKVIQTGDF